MRASAPTLFADGVRGPGPRSGVSGVQARVRLAWALSGWRTVVARKPARHDDLAPSLPRLLDRRFGLRPGRGRQAVVLVFDNGPVDTSTASMAALAAQTWITVERLPHYDPELNEIEVSCRDLKRHYLAHRTFADVTERDQAILNAVANLRQERRTNPCDKLRIAA
jgi:transposase